MNRLTLNVVSLCLAAAGLSTAQAADVVISADRLLDVKSGRMIQNPEILVRDGKVVSLKPDAKMPAAPDATRIALPGMTLVPA